VCTVLAAASLAVACADDGGTGLAASAVPARVQLDTVADHNDELVVVEGFVVAAPEAVHRLCGALAESYPPQCAGTRMAIVGLELARLTAASTNDELPEGERTLWTDGTVTLTGRVDGDQLELADAGNIGTGIIVEALAGPTCPVEHDPPDPACAPQPVVGAAIELRRRDETVASTTTDSIGVAAFTVDTGTYQVVALPVINGPTAPSPVGVVVGETAERVTLDYDTGIR
jgi:hypothetical protein